MIQCPICKSLCFDDMDVCYGCMHRFGADSSVEGFMASGLPDFEPEEPKESDKSIVQDENASASRLVAPIGNPRVELVISIQPVVVYDRCRREGQGEARDYAPSEDGVDAREIALEAESILVGPLELNRRDFVLDAQEDILETTLS